MAIMMLSSSKQKKDVKIPCEDNRKPRKYIGARRPGRKPVLVNSNNANYLENLMYASINGSNLAAPQHRYRFDFVVKKPMGDSFPYMVPRGYRSSNSRAFSKLPTAAAFTNVAKLCRFDQVILFSEWQDSIGSFRIVAIYSQLDKDSLGAWHFADYARRQAHMSPMIRKPSAAMQKGEQQ